MDLTPYLNFNGNCAEAFRFYADVLGGKIDVIMTHGESPVKDTVEPDWHDRVMHACLRVGDRLLLGCDAPPAYHKTPQGMRVTIGVDDKQEGERIFQRLSDGGTVTMPFQQTFWSPGFGMVTDRFGTPWMVNSQAA